VTEGLPPVTKIFFPIAKTRASLQPYVREQGSKFGAQAPVACLQLSTAIEVGQLGAGWVMLMRSPAAGPKADTHTRLLPFSSGTMMYLVESRVGSSKFSCD
jgi:hypothetical protein